MGLGFFLGVSWGIMGLAFFPGVSEGIMGLGLIRVCGGVMGCCEVVI